MKTLLGFCILAALFVITPGACFALMGISNVSKDQAKEWGVQVRLKDSGPKDYWVELEFKPEGRWKNFDHVSLEIREGDKLLVGYAPLKEKRTSTGSVVVGFMANRDYLDKITLSIVTGFPMDMTGNELHLKDFVDQEKAVK